MGGKDGNLSEENLRDYEERIKEIKPCEVHLYPLLYQPFPGFNLNATSREKLDELAKKIEKSTNSQVRTFTDPTNIGGIFKY